MPIREYKCPTCNHTQEHLFMTVDEPKVVICERCGKIVDFSIKSLNTLKAEMGKDKNFKLDNISIQVFGVCRSCQKASRNNNGILNSGFS